MFWQLYSPNCQSLYNYFRMFHYAQAILIDLTSQSSPLISQSTSLTTVFLTLLLLLPFRFKYRGRDMQAEETIIVLCEICHLVAHFFDLTRKNLIFFMLKILYLLPVNKLSLQQPTSDQGQLTFYSLNSDLNYLISQLKDELQNLYIFSKQFYISSPFFVFPHPNSFQELTVRAY